MDPLRNPKDPLRTSGPQSEQDLFRALATACSGYPMEVAMGAAANVLLNAIRQRCETRVEAECEFDEMFGRLKALLLDQHYGSTGRRNVFPFHQIVRMPTIDLRGKH